jgi:hypothetical protein
VATRILDLTVESPDPATKRGLEDVYSQLLDTDLIAVVSPRGENLAIEASIAELGEVWAQLTSDTFGSMSAPLPTEPVGAGATWQTVAHVSAEGLTILQTATYRLISWDGTRMQLEVETEQGIDPATRKTPGIEYAVTGSGTSTILLDLTRLLPESSATEATSEFTAVFTEDGEEQTMNQLVRISMILSSLGSPPGN